MGGPRSKNFYISKFGEDEGNMQFENLLSRRGKRIRSQQADRKVIKTDDTEKDLADGLVIRCEACGYIGTRLQWTHFANKCSMKTSNEYLKAFPNAPLLAPVLRKLLGVTQEGMLKLHGAEEGQKRWESYCSKQAETNTLAYKKEKYGWSQEEFQTYNASRAATRDNLIARWGEIDGLEKWQSYLERQKYTTSIEYFIEEYGEIIGRERFYDFCKGRNFGDKNKSNVEQKIFEELKIQICDLCEQVTLDNVYFSGFDYGCLKNKLLVEFYGTYWHCDPRFYEPDTIHPQKKQAARRIWSRDQAKRTFAINRGYQVYVIWEYDYTVDPEGTINLLVKWWKENNVIASSSL